MGIVRMACLALALIGVCHLAACGLDAPDSLAPAHPPISQWEWDAARLAAVGPKDGKHLLAIAAQAGASQPIVLNPRVLMYHDFVASGATGEQVNRDTFMAQMGFLKQGGYEPITAEDLYSAYIGKSKLSEKAVLLTFDDSDEGQYTYARPVLRTLGFKATFFVLPEVAGAKGHLSWPQIEALDQPPLFRAYSHTNLHSLLPELRYAELGHALGVSRKILEEKLGGQRDFFAYPNGDYNLPVMALTERYYKMAFAVGGDRVPGVAPQLQVPRIGIGSDVTTLGEFEKRLGETRVILPELADMRQALNLAAEPTHPIKRPAGRALKKNSRAPSVVPHNAHQRKIQARDDKHDRAAQKQSH